MTQPVIIGKKTKRYGVFRVEVESNHAVRGLDGVVRQFTVKEKRLLPENAKTKVFCKFCKRDWPTEKEMLAAHPNKSVMVKQEESHVYMWHLLGDFPDPSSKSGVRQEITAIYSGEEENG